LKFLLGTKRERERAMTGKSEREGTKKRELGSFSSERGGLKQETKGNRGGREEKRDHSNYEHLKRILKKDRREQDLTRRHQRRPEKKKKRETLAVSMVR